MAVRFGLSFGDFPVYTTDGSDFLHTVVTHRKVANVFQALTPGITVNALHELSHLILKIFEESVF